MLKLIDRYLLNPHWRTIRTLGQVKILGISATTIIVFPLLSRTLIRLNEMATTIRQSHPALDAVFPLIKLQFQLPFSLKLVVCSAIFAIIGKLIYEGACPLYIKAGDVYQEFRNSQSEATSVLADAFLMFMQQADETKRGQMVSGLQVLGRSFSEPKVHEGAATEWMASTTVSMQSSNRICPKGPISDIVRQPELAEPIFYVLRDVMDDCRKKWRILCASAYYIALGLLIVALAIQLCWAVRGLLL